MSEKTEYQPVTQSDFKNELKALRLEFKEALIDLNKGIQEQIHALHEKMRPLDNLDTIIFKNTLRVMLSVLIPLGGVLVWWIDREIDQNQIRISRIEEAGFTSNHQIVLTKVNALLDAYHGREKNKEIKNSSSSKQKKKRIKRKINNLNRMPASVSDPNS